MLNKLVTFLNPDIAILALPKYDVLGIGNAIVDVLTHVDDDFLNNQKLDKGGMMLVSAAEAAKVYESLGQCIE